MASKINPHVLRYIGMVESGEIVACEEQHLLAAHIRECFKGEDIYTDEESLEKYLSLVKYFPYDRLFEWEEFLFALHNCTFRAEDNRPRWPDLFCLGGRGLGKDGYIAFDSFAMASPYNPIPNYNIEICANNEEQAMTPVLDIVGALDNPSNTGKLKKHYYWTKERVRGLKNGAIIRGRTNNPKGKDGLRPGKIFFNEIHQFENYDNINVFTTAFGKVPHPRSGYMTTNGDVRDGPLDDLLTNSEEILRQGEPDHGLLPFICRLDNKEEVHDPKNWAKANPSLPYRPDLEEEIRKEYRNWEKGILPAFMTKRMNIPDTNAELMVTDYENIKVTNRPLPDLTGWECVAGIDYVKVTDFASVNLHFRRGEQRFDINHSWLCTNSADMGRIKAPLSDWQKLELLTMVNDVEIHPSIICNHLLRMSQKYHIRKLALDNYRYALLAKHLEDIGFDAKDRKNIKLVGPPDIMKIVPVVDSAFANQCFAWGDNPVLRWAARNTKKVRSGKTMGTDTGNYYYAKIEGRSRKTDPFMALVACMVIENELDSAGPSEILPVITF